MEAVVMWGAAVEAVAAMVAVDCTQGFIWQGSVLAQRLCEGAMWVRGGLEREKKRVWCSSDL